MGSFATSFASSGTTAQAAGEELRKRREREAAAKKQEKALAALKAGQINEAAKREEELRRSAIRVGAQPSIRTGRLSDQPTVGRARLSI